VLTPRLEALTDYRVDAASVPTIDLAARTLAARLGRPRVGVMGFSFAGGLALIAGSRPETSSAIGLIVAVGAHDELARVTRFFAEGAAPAPHGPPLALRPHEYGPLVLAYGHPASFFSAADVSIAHEAMRLALWEQHDEANRLAETLSPEGKERWRELTTGDRRALSSSLEALARDEAQRLRDASPHGKLGGLRVPVFLLHGSGDSVIPPTETEWLASEVPPEDLREALVSPVVQHVELQGAPTWIDELRLVRFLGRVMAELDAV
jgi:pimeloyl-ACP methyl ester carboxylesterase